MVCNEYVHVSDSPPSGMMPAQDRGPAAGRNRYADLLRVLAIGAVTIGHWLLTSITYRDGQLSGLDAIHYISWAGGHGLCARRG